MVVAVAAGAALGVFSTVVDSVAPAWAGNSLALWLLVAFLVGRRGRTAPGAAACGCVALVVANCAYYAWRLFVGDNVGIRFAVRAFSFWTALAIPSGLASGAASRWGREGSALPAGAFAAEAAFSWFVRGRGAHAVAAAAVAVPLAVSARWTRRGVWLALAAGVAVAAGMAGARELMLQR